MIKIYEKGQFIKDGQIMTDINISMEEAKRNTITYDILKKHNSSGDMENLKIKFDAITSPDNNSVSIIQTAKASGLKKFPVPYVLSNCHNSLCAIGGTINEDDHQFGLSAAKKYGGIFPPPSHGCFTPIYEGALRRLRKDDPGIGFSHEIRSNRKPRNWRRWRRGSKAAP